MMIIDTIRNEALISCDECVDTVGCGSCLLNSGSDAQIDHGNKFESKLERLKEAAGNNTNEKSNIMRTEIRIEIGENKNGDIGDKPLKENNNKCATFDCLRDSHYIAAKSFMRRSISECRYIDENSERDHLNKARHSFSAFECNNQNYSVTSPENIIKNFIKEIALNKLTSLELEENLIDGPVNNAQNKNQVTTELINSAKQSIIDEYKILKKNNSCVKVDQSAEEYQPNYFVQRKIKERVTKKLRDDVINEKLENNVSDKVEEDVLSDSRINIPVAEDNLPESKKPSAYCDSTPSGVFCDIQGLLFTDGLQLPSSEDQSNSSSVSPPDRLQSWKNILARKKSLAKNGCEPDLIRDQIDTLKKQPCSEAGYVLSSINTETRTAAVTDEHSIEYCELKENKNELTDLEKSQASDPIFSEYEYEQQKNSLENACKGISDALAYIPQNNSLEDDKNEQVTECCTNKKSKDNETDDYYESDGCEGDCDFCISKLPPPTTNKTSDVNAKVIHPYQKYRGVKTNGSLKSLRDGHEVCRSPPSIDIFQMLKKPFAKLELGAIQEFNGQSSGEQLSDEECSCDESICDLSSSWKFGLCRDPDSLNSSLKSQNSSTSLPYTHSPDVLRLKSNSLPIQIENNEVYLGLKRPPLPPKNKLRSSISSSPPNCYSSQGLRPAMGLQGLQQKSSPVKQLTLNLTDTAPKQIETKSPSTPFLLFDSPNHNPFFPPGGPAAPPSPRTSIRTGALVCRNFSISDDECSNQGDRRQVTITRHDSNPKTSADGTPVSTISSVDPCWISWAPPGHTYLGLPMAPSHLHSNPAATSTGRFQRDPTVRFQCVYV